MRKKNIFLLENIPWGRSNAADGVKGLPHLLFVGNLNYNPNLEGLQHFVRHVWPCILERHPEARLQIVGDYPAGHPTVECLIAAPGIDLLGRVETLAHFYHSARFAICPVYWGGGTKIKVLESLSFGKAIVVSSHAFSGYEARLEDQESIVVAYTDEAFCQACVRLLVDDSFREKLERNGKRVCDQYFSFDAFKEQFFKVLVQ